MERFDDLFARGVEASNGAEHNESYFDYQFKRLQLLSRSLSLTYQKRPEFFEVLTGVSPSVELSVFLTNIGRDESLRSEFIDEITKITHSETERIITENNGIIRTDLLVLGTGPSGTVIGTKIKAKRPGINLAYVDRRVSRGGTIADHSLFPLNTSRDGKRFGYAGELSSPNSMGSEDGEITVELDKFAAGRYPTNKEFEYAVSMRNFLSGPALTDVELIPPLVIPNSTNIPYIVDATYNGSQRIKINAMAISLNSGLGEPVLGLDTSDALTRQAVEKEQGRNILDSEQWDRSFEAMSPTELRYLIDQGLVIIGAGDSTNVALESIITLLRQEFNDDEIKTFRPIEVYGARYETPEEFMADIGRTYGEERYGKVVPSFIGSFVRPHRERLEHISIDENSDSLVINSGSLKGTKVRTIISMAGYKNNSLRRLLEGTVDESGNPVFLPIIDIEGQGEFKGTVIGRRLGNTRIYVGGASLGLSTERSERIASYTVKRYAPKNRVLADLIISDLDRLFDV